MSEFDERYAKNGENYSDYPKQDSPYDVFEEENNRRQHLSRDSERERAKSKEKDRERERDFERERERRDRERKESRAQHTAADEDAEAKRNGGEEGAHGR